MIYGECFLCEHNTYLKESLCAYCHVSFGHILDEIDAVLQGMK